MSFITRRHVTFLVLLPILAIAVQACGGGGSSGTSGASGSSSSSSADSVTGYTANSESFANTNMQGSQWHQAVTGLSNGNYVVTWEDQRAGWVIKYRMFNAAGSAITDERQIDSLFSNAEQYPSVAPLAGGAYVIAWQGRDDSTVGYYVKAQRFDASGNTVGDAVLVPTGGGYAMMPRVLTLASGNYLVAWRLNGYVGQDHIYAQMYDASGNKVGSVLTLGAITPDLASNSGGYSLAALADGGFVMAWGTNTSQAGSPLTRNAAAQVFDSSGAAKGTAFFLNDAANIAKYPKVASLANGGFVGAWESASVSTASSDNLIRAQRFTSAITKNGNEVTTNTNTTNALSFGDIAGLGSGGYVAASLMGGQVFKSDGTKLGAEFSIVSPDNMPSSLTMAPGADGGFIVAWSYFQATDNGIDIKVKTFSPQLSH